MDGVLFGMVFGNFLGFDTNETQKTAYGIGW